MTKTGNTEKHKNISSLQVELNCNKQNTLRVNRAEMYWNYFGQIC